MRLKEILNETFLTEGRTNSMSVDEASKIFRKKCYGYTEENTQIFRGVRGFNKKYGFIQPKSGGQRPGTLDHSYYTLLIDNLNSWRKYPNRGNSIICSTTDSQAISYGNLYLVIPFNAANIGVCPKMDIWYSFRNTIGLSLSDFDSALLELSDTALGRDIDVNTFQSFKEDIQEISHYIKKENPQFDSFTENLIENYKKSDIDNFYGYIKTMFDPKKNGFERYTYSPSFRVNGNKEVWTDSPSILIRHNFVDEFFRKVNSEWQMGNIEYKELLRNYKYLFDN